MPRALAVVAHHDDHVLWMGGTIRRLADLNWSWLLVAMCVPDKAQRQYFEQCARAYRQEFASMAFEDYQAGDVFSRNDEIKMKTELARVVSGWEFDLVFTHSRDAGRGEGGGARGEYGGHANHTEVRQVVAALVTDGVIRCQGRSVVQFAYSAMNVPGTATSARRDASCFVQLTYDELRQKCDLCARAPDLEDSLRNLAFPCPNPEAFETQNLALPDSVFIRR